jgi:glycosyltransferase involved in cell wall biosynthesis
MSASRILIISHDVVDDEMAGPGIRYWELARQLARTCDVTLCVPWRSKLSGDDFAVLAYQPGDWAAMRALAEAADAVMPCGTVLHQFPGLLELSCAVIVDGYDPYPAETLHLMAGRPAHEQAAYHANLAERLRLECLGGDFYLCASERQRHWWLGLLAAHGRLNIDTHIADPTLRNLVAVVPFGCQPAPPRPTRRVLKGIWPGIGAHDPVLIWGGGIWEWLDPLTLLHAVAQLAMSRPNVRLVFPGTRHPNPVVEHMPMRDRAVALARELGLLNTHVFFGDWVPYVEWGNYLLEADVGLSLHTRSLEAELAFRSRVVEYIGAGLPMVVTEGDTLAEVVEQYDLGYVVGHEDAAGVAVALDRLLAEPRAARNTGFSTARQHLRWEQVVRPLVHFCQSPHRAADYERRRAIPSDGAPPGPNGLSPNPSPCA